MSTAAETAQQPGELGRLLWGVHTDAPKVASRIKELTISASTNTTARAYPLGVATTSSIASTLPGMQVSRGGRWGQGGCLELFHSAQSLCVVHPRR